jgi:hypothetical protein
MTERRGLPRRERGKKDLAACRAARLLVGLRGRVTTPARGVSEPRAPTSTADPRAVSLSRNRGRDVAAAAARRPRRSAKGFRLPPMGR